MTETLDFDGFVKMFRSAVQAIESGHEELSRLDSQGGDGDHGTTMVRAMRGVEMAIECTPRGNIRELLKSIGWAVLGIDGGATGPLFGMLFTGMAESAADRESFNAEDITALFRAGLTAVERHTRARVGDKTMMDALIPGVAAMEEGARDGDDVHTVLKRAAEAAEAGAVSTENLEARFGRAKNLGSRSVGSRDPGAVSVALIFRGFTRGTEE